MAVENPKTKDERDAAHQKVAEQVATTGDSSVGNIEQVEKGSAEKAAHKALHEEQRAGFRHHCHRRIPTSADEAPVDGLLNEDLWMLIRRFDKAFYHVKAVPPPPSGIFDLYRSEEEVFSPDTLRAALERFYATVVVGLTNVAKHIVRLRSWQETRRTTVFCAVYFVAWLLDLMTLTFLGTLLVLILWPTSRELLFPPAPISLVSPETGGAQKPKAGVLGSKDTITGAPENFKGEAVEQEASNLVSGASRLALASAGGKHDKDEPADVTKDNKSLDNPANIASETADAAAAASGGVPSAEHDKTKQPMMEVIQENAVQITGIIADVTDTYERISNAFSPKPPFLSSWPRIRIALLLTAAFAVVLAVPSYIFIKTSTFLAGLGFFGDPVIGRIAKLLASKPRDPTQGNFIFKGVPTNAQLTLTLLRIGEANDDPLPSPPNSLEPKSSQPVSVSEEELPAGSSDEEVKSALSEDSTESEQESQGDAQPKKKTWGSSLVNFFRGATAAGVETKLTFDYTKAAMGSMVSKKYLGILRKKRQNSQCVSLTTFSARYKGQKGAIVITPSTSSKEPLTLYFTTDPSAQSEDHGMEEQKKKKTTLFSIPIHEIQELKKIGGMGWKGKLLVGWSEPNKEVVDGLTIVGKNSDQRYQVTAIGRRNSLFNRLIAMNGTFWESC
ncbi:hypothetical protein AJ79_08420 [Helicocarpus griseus UAMH5409]|uniref:Uncharacterized protein n=1 Tax=Helicocarpus griseus UAMH5409 TaxID=1447875 RepID=A0A2B7WT78_9EURO|nr:hypothetical protein AJ79_08420 [Helicocarpus griseus UAMH5409]